MDPTTISYFCLWLKKKKKAQKGKVKCLGNVLGMDLLPPFLKCAFSNKHGMKTCSQTDLNWFQNL